MLYENLCLNPVYVKNFPTYLFSSAVGNPNKQPTAINAATYNIYIHIYVLMLIIFFFINILYVRERVSE